MENFDIEFSFVKLENRIKIVEPFKIKKSWQNHWMQKKQLKRNR